MPLAKDKVRHVGEPLAVVLAESRYAAEDGVGRIFADIEPIDAVVDLESALAPGAPRPYPHQVRIAVLVAAATLILVYKGALR